MHGGGGTAPERAEPTPATTSESAAEDADRASADARARRALAEFEVDGLATTLPFHRWILENDDFLAGRTSTGWTEQAWPRES